MGSIPPINETADHFWKLVAGQRMEKYGEFVFIDRIAKEYKYTHDQVFNMSWREVYTILALNREQGYIEHKVDELKREHERLGGK